MTEMIVLGQPYWGTRIARALHDPEHGSSAAFVGQRGYAGLLARRPGAPLIFLRAGFRVGGTTRRARAFDAYWSVLRRRFPKAAGVHYWLGTDVLNTVEEAAAGTLRLGLVARARSDAHLADAAWLADELQGVGIKAETAHVPQPYRAPAEVPGLPPAFTVLTYVPGDRFSFYGGEAIVETARRLPQLSFQVMGRQAEPGPAVPGNVQLLGWVGDIDAAYRAATVVVRVPRHDGFGATVIEGLLYARHVIYTYPVPSCEQVWPVTPDALVAALERLNAAHLAGTLGPNVAGRTHALAEFNEAALVERLRRLVGGAA